MSKLGYISVIFVDLGVKVDGTYCCDLLLSQQLLPATRHVSVEFRRFLKTVLQHIGHSLQTLIFRKVV